MAMFMVVVATQDYSSREVFKPRPLQEISIEDGHAVRVSGTPLGVRFYWVLQN